MVEENVPEDHGNERVVEENVPEDHGNEHAVEENVPPCDNEDGDEQQSTDDGQPHRLLKRKTSGEDLSRDDNDDDHTDVHLDKKRDVPYDRFYILHSMINDLTSLEESITSSLVHTFDLLDKVVSNCN